MITGNTHAYFQCKPGSQRGRVSQADPSQDPENKEFLVTSMFGSSSEENKKEDKNEDANRVESPTSSEVVVRKKQVSGPAPQPEKTPRRTAAVLGESKRRRKQVLAQKSVDYRSRPGMLMSTSFYFRLTWQVSLTPTAPPCDPIIKRNLKCVFSHFIDRL